MHACTHASGTEWHVLCYACTGPCTSKDIQCLATNAALYHVICPEPGRLSSYGVVHVSGVCSSCDRSRNNCCHAKLHNELGLRIAPSPQEKPVPDVAQCMDFASGKRKLTCLSSMPLPQHPTGMLCAWFAVI